MGDVSQRMVGASQDTVHFSNVRPVIGSDHDGVQRWRRAVKVYEQATFVAFGFHCTCEHLKTCAILRPSLFGVVGFSRPFVAEAKVQHRASTRWP